MLESIRLAREIALILEMRVLGMTQTNIRDRFQRSLYWIQCRSNERYMSETTKMIFDLINKEREKVLLEKMMFGKDPLVNARLYLPAVEKILKTQVTKELNRIMKMTDDISEFLGGKEGA